MIEEDVDTPDLVNMETDIDDEDIVGWALEESIYDDPLLSLKPIVYTTKLDNMNTVKQDLRELNAQEIIKKLQSENKPKFTLDNMQRSTNSRNIESFMKLSSVVNHINFKARLQTHSTNVRNTRLLKQCKSFNIVLKDTKNNVSTNKTVTALKKVPNESQGETALIVSSNGISKVCVKMEAIDSFVNELSEPEVNKTGFVSSDNEVSKVQRKNDVTEILLDSDSNKSLPSTENESSENKLQHNLENKSSAKTNKTAETQHNSSEAKSFAKKSKTINSQCDSTEIVSSDQKTITKKLPCTNNPEIADEDDAALINLKRKPIKNVITQQPSLEKYALIVLLHLKEEAFVYRVNISKLITDYYITTEYDEYKLAAIYPKEEKIIENYCCWIKREEVITKICTRKNYPFSIQKFLRQPHSCHPGDCECCCHTNSATNQSKQAHTKVFVAVKKSVVVADSWIRGLLNRNQPATVGLVGKALSYIPKTQVKEKPMEIEREKYLEFVLISLKYSGSNKFNHVAELYEIGKNGDVVRSFFLDNYEEENHIRRTYHLLGIKTTEATFCCWYQREKIMHDLRMAKMSPTALKLIQIPHFCERKNCNCCCKPRTMPLEPLETLPTTLKHTTSYEKNVRVLTIRFNVKSKLPLKKVKKSYLKSSKIQNITDASTAATILSSCASKEDNQDLSISILSKFKNLKLGVTSCGKIEAILNGPAKKLSIPELTVLSDILALSTKQTVELGLSPEEFCKRINSKSGQFNPVAVKTPEIPLIRASISPPKQQDDTNEQIVSSLNLNKLKNVTPILTSQAQQNKQTNNEPIRKSGRVTQSQNKPIIEPRRKTTTSKISSTKSSTNMYSSISNLMEMKNKNYVDSFKSFFKNNVPSNVVVPEMIKFPLVHGLARAISMEETSLPKIAETFTLATSPSEASDIAVAGPSGITRRPRIESPSIVEVGTSGVAVMASSRNVNPGSSMTKTTELSRNKQTPAIRITPIKTYGTRNATKRKLDNLNNSQIDKKIRIKSPSELIAEKTQVPVTAGANNSQTALIPPWPAPILIKREPHTNIQSIVNSSQATPIKVNPNLQTQGYLVGNNVVTAPNTTQAVQNVYHVNEIGVTRVSSASNSSGVRYLTLTPISAPRVNNVNKTMLAQILKTPQVQPIAGANRLPPLVHIRAENVVPAIAKNETRHLETDVENSISYNVIIDNTQK